MNNESLPLETSINGNTNGTAAACTASPTPTPTPTPTASRLPRFVRHAEKSRVSTCAFADRIARCAIDAFHSALDSIAASDPEAYDALKGGATQTVVSAVLVTTNTNSNPICLSIGGGTKVLSDAFINDAYSNGTGDEVVRDLHGEVLARRGLVRLLLDQLARGPSCEDANKPIRLLDWPTPPLLGSNNNLQPRLRSDLVFHFYTSSAPCGNATVRKWAKIGRKEVYRDDLGPAEWPTESHPRFLAQAKHEGQCAVLCKIASSGGGGSADPGHQDAGTSNQLDTDSDFPPPGTALPGHLRASSRASCSDKLARWCAIGLEGALVRSLLNADSCSARPTTVTVGRKFARPHLERALCCRISGFYAEKGLRHPAIMCSAVKLHEGAYDAERGARFSELALVWWAGAGAGETEILDTRTGRCRDNGAASGISRERLLAAWKRGSEATAGSDLGGFEAAASTGSRSYDELKARLAAMNATAREREWEGLVGKYLPDWPRRRAAKEELAKPAD